VVDKERMRPGYWLALAQCFDRKGNWPVKNLCPLSLKLLCWNKRKKTQEEQANLGSPEKRSLKWT